MFINTHFFLNKAMICNCTFHQLEYSLRPMKNLEPTSSSQAQPNVFSIESHLVVKPITKWLWISTDPILTLFLYLCVPLSLFTVRLPCPHCPQTHSFYTLCFILRLDAFVLPTNQNKVFRIHVHSHYCSKILSFINCLYINNHCFTVNLNALTMHSF